MCFKLMEQLQFHSNGEFSVCYSVGWKQVKCVKYGIKCKHKDDNVTRQN